MLRPSKGGTGPARWQRLIRIPLRAAKSILFPVPGGSQEGVEYKWWAGGKKIRVRMHDADPRVRPSPANPTPNARIGWVVRIGIGKRFLDPSGRVHAAAKVSPGSPEFDEFIANETHIPLTPPGAFP